MLTKTKSIINNLVVAIILAIFIPFMYIFRWKNRVVRKIMCKIIVACIGVKINLEGQFESDTKLYIVNHQSMLDIIAVESLHEDDLCWVSKKEITEYPYYGHINKAPRMISVDREDKSGLVKLFADVKDRLAVGRPIVIFPEGTRGKEPNMLEFKPGAKMIAEKLGLKVQPIVVVDSARFLTSKHFSPRMATDELEIVVLPSFVPQKGSNWFEETRELMQGVLDSKRKSVTNHLV